MNIPLQPAQLAAIRKGIKTCIRLPIPAQPIVPTPVTHGLWDGYMTFLHPEQESADVLIVPVSKTIYYPVEAEVEAFAPIFSGLKEIYPWEIAPGTLVLVTDLALERAFRDPEDDYSDEGTNGLYNGEGTAAERFAREYEARTGQPLTPGTWVLRVLFKYPYAL